MKKTIIALMAALAGVASADYTIRTDSSMYSSAWVYVWTGNGANNNWNTGLNWGYYESATDDQAASNGGYKPVNADPAFIGYDVLVKNSVQYLTANNKAITVTMPAKSADYSNTVYLGHKVTLYGESNLFTKDKTTTFDFGDFGGTSVISMKDFWMQEGSTVKFTGNINMTDDNFSYTLFTASNMQGVFGTWDASGVTVLDSNGNALTYTTDDDKIGKAGYYWIAEEGNKWGEYSVKLRATTIPEPTTATLSLLALAGLAARRRRR